MDQPFFIVFPNHYHVISFVGLHKLYVASIMIFTTMGKSASPNIFSCPFFTFTSAFLPFSAPHFLFPLPHFRPYYYFQSVGFLYIY